MRFALTMYALACFFYPSYAQSPDNFPKFKEKFKNTKIGHQIDSAWFSSKANTADLSNTFDWGDAPEWSWYDDFGGSDNDFVHDVVKDDLGNIYFVGSFSGQISTSVGSFTSVGWRDGIVGKLDPNGGPIWIEQIVADKNDRADLLSLTLDGTGNLLFTGSFTGRLAVGNFTLNGASGINLFWVEMDTSGQISFANNHLPLADHEIGIKIKTKDSHVYILGAATSRLSDEHPSVLLKYHRNGNLIWSQLHDESFNDMDMDPSGLYFTGAIPSSSDGMIGRFNFSPRVYGDLFIAKSDFDGQFIWAVMADENNPEFGTSSGASISVNTQNELFVTGYFRGQSVLGSDTLTSSDQNTLLAAGSTDGRFLWGRQIPDVSGIDVSQTGNELIVLSNNSVHQYNKQGDLLVNVSTNDLLGAQLFANSNNIILCGSRNELMAIRSFHNDLRLDWSLNISGNSYKASLVDLVVSGPEHFAVFGFSTSQMDYFGHQLEYGMFVAKHDKTGNVLWLTAIPGLDHTYFNQYSRMCVDQTSGQIYITGQFYDSFKINGGPNVTLSDDVGVFLAAFSADGQFLWVSQHDGNNVDVQDIGCDGTGNVLISGAFRDTLHTPGVPLISRGNLDAYIMKYNSSGLLQWAKSAGGIDGEITSLVTTDRSNNVYFAVEALSEVLAFDGSTIRMSVGEGNIFLAKLSAHGQTMWSNIYAGAAGSDPFHDDLCWPINMAVDGQDNLIIKGWYGDSTLFGNNLLLSPHWWFSKFLMKLDSDGQVLWANGLQETTLAFDYNDLGIDRDNSIYMGGQARGDLYFGDEYMYQSTGNRDLFFAKYTTNGTLDWVKIVAGGQEITGVNAVSVSDIGEVFVAGYFNEKLNFDDDVLTSSTVHGYFGMMHDMTVAVKNDVSDRTYDHLVFPNPVTSKVHISFARHSYVEQVEICDQYGHVIHAMGGHSFPETLSIDMSSLARGLYFITVQDKTGRHSKKIVIE